MKAKAVDMIYSYEENISFVVDFSLFRIEFSKRIPILK